MIVEIGNTYNRLTIISSDVVICNGRKRTYYVCLCSCGKYTTVEHYKLIYGTTKSCGCLRISKIKQLNLNHNDCNSKIYNIWAGIKQRCLNINSKSYKHYGGRGINIYEPWINDFAAFRDYVGKRPNGMTIDRIDNNKGYIPGNIRWANSKVQSNNRRCNIKIQDENSVISLCEFAESIGLKIKTVYKKLRYDKMSIDEIKKNKDLIRRHNVLEIDGEIVTIAEAARYYKIPESTLHYSIKLKGMSLSDAIESYNNKHCTYNNEVITYPELAKKIGVDRSTLYKCRRSGMGLNEILERYK